MAVRAKNPQVSQLGFAARAKHREGHFVVALGVVLAALSVPHRELEPADLTGKLSGLLLCGLLLEFNELRVALA